MSLTFIGELTMTELWSPAKKKNVVVENSLPQFNTLTYFIKLFPRFG